MRPRDIVRRSLLLLLGLVVLRSVGAQEIEPGSILDGATPLVAGHTVTLHSEILNEDRKLLIYLPADAMTSELPLQVIYLLDGRANFAHTASIVDLLVINARMPRSMIVGIANTDRSRDLTGVVTEGRSSGGADRFLAFLATELIPFIDNHFNTGAHRTLIGHSLGGLFVMHTLVERPDLFDAAIAISPAVTNDERVGDGSTPVSQRLKAAFEDHDPWTFRLFITTSDGEDPRWETDLAAVVDGLKTAAPEEFVWDFRRMNDDDHGTTVLASTNQGLRFINADWDTRDLLRQGNLDQLMTRFEGLSERLGYELHPPEPMVNFLGYRLLAAGRPDEAVAVFEKNIELYPESANVYDSLGEALEAEGKLPGAMRSYRKAVARAEASGDQRLMIFRQNLARVEAALQGEATEPSPLFETPRGEGPDGSPGPRGSLSSKLPQP